MAECYPQGCPPCMEEISFPENPINGQRECFHIGKDPNTGEDILKCWVYDQCVPGWRAEGPAVAPISFKGGVDLTKTEAENNITAKEAGDYYVVSVGSVTQDFLDSNWVALQHPVSSGAYILWSGTAWVETPSPCSGSGSVGDGKITIKQNGITKGEFNVNQSNDTTIELDSGSSAGGAPVGSIMAFPTDTPPEGYVKCNGAALSETTYSNLFALIGTTYGTAGAGTFRVPDLRGYFVRGWDDGRSIDDGRAIGSDQEHGVGPHTHYFQDIEGTVINFQDTLGRRLSMDIGGGIDDFGDYSMGPGNRGQKHAGLGQIAEEGEKIITETRPVNIALLYCIKY